MFVVLLWTHSNSFMPLCWGLLSCMQKFRWGKTRAEKRDRITPIGLLATLLLIQPWIQLTFWAASAHCWVVLRFSSTSTLKFLTGLDLFIPQPELIPGVATAQVQEDLELNLVEPHEIPIGPTSWAYPGPSGWDPVRHVGQMPSSSWCHLHICWGCTRSFCLVSLMKILNTTGSSTDSHQSVITAALAASIPDVSD